MREFSFVVLTYNEEIHLSKLIESIQKLNAPVYILDSGSTDSTLKIAENFNTPVKSNKFENHSKQWDYALRVFEVTTPWTICLDADQIVSSELFRKLEKFKDSGIPEDVNGIYFNRKNYFKGRWIKHGGYYPKYLLKMFRTGIGYADPNENMDHRFIVPGKTIIWKDGHIKEENLKENAISFWIDKHNRYSDLVAQEEIERREGIRNQIVTPKLFGSPDQRTACLKKIWWKLPLFVRPFIYLFYRFVIRLGFLDGWQGWMFHFLQGFWFRFIVDVKIKEKLERTTSAE
ncbi:MAG TPA: glycosyltransferase family 2 protein [Ignavibacteriaceae bacterium]|nr:glycosyltransferase family 2 protein [Ignavibacteriaceae bacterium]